MTEWRLKNGARLRFLRQYSQRRPVQSRGRACALQACARSLFKNTNENKSDSITAGDLILAPISNLNPWFALHPGGGPWCGPTRNHFCSCRFPASVQLQLLVGMIYVHWRIAFHAQYLFSRWELRQKSRTAIPEHDYDTHDVGELWLQGGGGERLREEMRGEQTRVVICGWWAISLEAGWGSAVVSVIVTRFVIFRSHGWTYWKKEEWCSEKSPSRGEVAEVAFTSQAE